MEMAFLPMRKQKSYIVLFNIDNKKLWQCPFTKNKIGLFILAKDTIENVIFYENHYIITF